MKRMTRNVIAGYVGFCAVNWAASYYAARSGSPLLFGSAALLNFNENLRRLNALSWVIDPLAVAQRAGSSAAPAAAGQVFAPDAPAQITQTPIGTTTYFGNSG